MLIETGAVSVAAFVPFGPLLFPIARTVGIREVPSAMGVVLAMGIGAAIVTASSDSSASSL